MQEQAETETENATQYAGFWRRLLALIIDTLILGLINALFIVVSPFGNETAPAIHYASLFEDILLSILPPLYYIIMHGKYGATLGKMVVRAKIVTLDEKNINYKIATIRYSPYLFMMVASVIFTLEEMYKTSLLGILSVVLAGVFGLYSVISVAQLIFYSKKRTIHDYIAGTMVVIKPKSYSYS